jgi:hypothetical protein
MDIAATVRFATRGNVLELPELREVSKTLSVLINLQAFLDVAPVSPKPAAIAESEWALLVGGDRALSQGWV